MQRLHKATNFGRILRKDGLDRRIELQNIRRKNWRNALYCDHRDMNDLDETATKKSKLEEQDRKVEERRIKLENWKKEKELRKKQEQKGKKPLFKVHRVVQSVGAADLSLIYKKIKDKPIKRVDINKTVAPDKPVKPTKTDKTVDNPKTTAPKIPLTANTYNLRSRNEAKAPVKDESKQQKAVTAKRKVVAKKEAAAKMIKSDVSVKKTGKPKNAKKKSPEIPVEPKDCEKTPKMDEDAVKNSKEIVYVSPFVTMSRGKDNARKEYLQGRTTDSRNEAAYFYEIIKNQTEKINNSCREWQDLKDKEQQLPEEAVDMINVAIGQSQLLINEKFRQFRTLVDRYSSEDAKETVVTSEDLHGFWDMVFLQVTNINKRFENLASLKSNGWEEIIPVVDKLEQKKKKRKKVDASSRLKDFLRAARSRKAEDINKNKENTPANGSRPRTSSSKGSKRVSTVKKNKESVSSPGLSVMSASRSAKSLLNPSKSILKSGKSASKTSSSERKVAFSCGNNEAAAELINWDDPLPQENPRRSLRKKLF